VSKCVKRLTVCMNVRNARFPFCSKNQHASTSHGSSSSIVAAQLYGTTDHRFSTECQLLLSLTR